MIQYLRRPSHDLDETFCMLIFNSWVMQWWKNIILKSHIFTFCCILCFFVFGVPIFNKENLKETHALQNWIDSHTVFEINPNKKWIEVSFYALFSVIFNMYFMLYCISGKSADSREIWFSQLKLSKSYYPKAKSVPNNDN